MNRLLTPVLLALLTLMALPTHITTAEEKVAAAIEAADDNDLIIVDSVLRKPIGVMTVPNEEPSLSPTEEVLSAPASFGKSDQRQALLPETVNMTPVNNSKEMPMRWVGLPQSYFGSTKTAFLFSNNDVIASGDSVVRHTISGEQEWAWDLQFCPGYNELQLGDPSPFGCIRNTQLFAPKAWAERLNPVYNYAFITLEAQFDIGYFGFSTGPDAWDGTFVNTIGNKDTTVSSGEAIGQYYASRCPILSTTTIELEHDCEWNTAGSPLVNPGMEVRGFNTYTRNGVSWAKIIDAGLFRTMSNFRNENNIYLPVVRR